MELGEILDEIIETKKQHLKKAKDEIPESQVEKKATEVDRDFHSFKQALSGGQISLIAEIKKESPSRGQLTELDVESVARVYESGPPEAVSVLTDEPYFGQNLEALKQARQILNKPILRKDFIIDPYQIYETAVAGADCILLIAAILDKRQLADYYSLAEELGMEALVEIHDIEELEKLSFVPELLGINNRRLQGDLSTDLAQTAQFMPFKPQKSLLVSESGIDTRADVEYLNEIGGVNAMLVGTALLEETKESEEITNRINELISSGE